MKIKPTHTLISIALALASLAHSTSASAEWTGGVEGDTVIQGDSTGTRLRFKMTNNERPFNQEVYADWIRNSSSSSSYEIGYKPKYWFTERTYVFGDASLGTAKSLQIDQQRKLFAGAGFQVLNSTTQKLFIEAGAGRTSTTYRSVIVGTESVTAAATDTDSTLVRFGAEQILTDLIKFELDGDYSTSDDIEQRTGVAGVALRIPGGSVKYSYRLRSVVIGNAEPVDTTDSSVSFSYEF